MRVERRDHADIKGLADYLGKHRVRVGFFETDKYASENPKQAGLPVAYIATIQEFGYPAGGIPSRPFFRNAIAQGETEWIQEMSKLMTAAMKGRLTGEQALAQMGALIEGAVKTSIIDGSYEPLAQATIDAKQAKKRTPGVSTKPLIDTGQMLQSVSHEVSKR